MKTIILSMLLLSSYVNAMAMNIKGRVIDSASQPIGFANVSGICERLNCGWLRH